MRKTIGFIGAGNMASAIIGGIVKSNLVEASNIYASNRSEGKLIKLKEEYGINIDIRNIEIAKTSDILFLAVKPNMYESVIKEIKDYVKEDVIIVAIAAGQSIRIVENLFEKEIKVIRTMPNTPALVGEAMTAICANEIVTEEEIKEVESIFNSFGKSEIVGEYLMDTVTGVSGSSPAYVYMFIEAMADAAVLGGMPRQQAYKFAAQSVLGSAKMVLDTGMHPGELKDMVTSPGGTTIEAVAKLEEKGMRDAIISAINTCIAKSKSMTK